MDVDVQMGPLGLETVPCMKVSVLLCQPSSLDCAWGGQYFPSCREPPSELVFAATLPFCSCSLFKGPYCLLCWGVPASRCLLGLFLLLMMPLGTK